MQTPLLVLQEVNELIKRVDKTQYDDFVNLLKQDRRFFFFGEGRSGLMAKAAAMRLMHCGKTVYVIGETTTPSMGQGDILLIVSGSGSSIQLNGLCKTARELGAEVAMLTADASKLQEHQCRYGLAIPAATKKRREWEPATIQPLGNQFDQAAHVVLDAAIIDGPYSEDSMENLTKRHTNLE
ncbi:6-phospho-3-hexuloisomerase [Planococcus sp. SSTMD024]|uniref:6-phospho-3-hexuloisomerase n=1 Tax=Planococcus sp. SSTMD024 TaxID=3242163 RepID=UPI00351ED24C